MTVGVAVGVAGGLALLAFMRRVPLPSEGLYSPRVLAGVLVIFGAATVAHGSGFLAVLVAGIIIGDEPAPYKREIERFHSSLAALAEIVAFVMLGLTMRLSELASASAWADGLALAALLTFVIRPGARRPGLAAGPADGARAGVLPVDRAQGRGADPARHGHRRLRHRRRGARPTRSSSSSSASR